MKKEKKKKKKRKKTYSLEEKYIAVIVLHPLNEFTSAD